MNVTQCNLSANSTKLDHEALLKVAKIATGHCIEGVASHLSKLRGKLFDSDITALHLEAHWLAREAQQLDVSAEVLATLMGSIAREDIEIVNKPEVKEF
ncbi:hypothetical protein LCGC14_0598790 [marine sediment metagenome]|uniref:ANTAR domain-containing protein n=1 Tax=marine sediment metagenome TaxID=412755 RepID=A0A0F9TXF8_9ZZZZ